MDDKPARKVRRILDNGRMRKRKNPASKSNATPSTKWIVSGLASKTFMSARIDRRTAMGKCYERLFSALTNHLGGEDNLSEPERLLCDQACKYLLLADISWQHMMEQGIFTEDGTANKALEAFTRCSRNQAEILRTLGIQRRPKEVMDLQDYIREHSG